MKNIVVLGSTGSIGTQALEVVRQHQNIFNVTGLAAGSNADLLLEQAREFRPEWVYIDDSSKAAGLERSLSLYGIGVLTGESMLLDAVTRENVDTVLVSIVGVKALLPTLRAIESGKHIALASKEILVAAGHIVMRKVQEKGVNLFPVDSEHAAVMQCLQGNQKKAIEKITLTASGGPFFGYSAEQLDRVTCADALCHPNWNMGKKITVDSATLINKGLEVIEAHWLFHVPYDDIDVVVHRESIVHSMVTYADGSTIAQLGMPDMCIPIQYALAYPERLPAPWPRIDLAAIGKLTFYAPDRCVFRCLDLAYEAGRRGGSAPVVLNAANEEAVALFLRDRIHFTDIPRIIERALNEHAHVADPALDDVIAIDRETRERVSKETAYG